jgi:hypothetical protein
MVPLNPDYEPLAQKVLTYIKEYEPDEYPFLLHENMNTSGRYLQTYAHSIFEGYHWYFVEYARSAFASPELGFTYDRGQGTKRKMITEDEVARYGSSVSYERKPGWTPIAVQISSHWRDVNTHELRKQRLRDVKDSYNFDGEQLDIYAGWEEKKMAQASKHYVKHDELELDLGEDPRIPMTLTKMGARYFGKLLRPISVLLDSNTNDAEGIEIIGG